jgi:hypothetical protein
VGFHFVAQLGQTETSFARLLEAIGRVMKPAT